MNDFAGIPPEQINVFSSEYRADPYPVYKHLRQHAPCLRSDRGFWLVTGYDPAARLLKEPRLRRFPPPRPDGHAAVEMEARWLMYSNPPDHTRMRRLITKAFTPRMVESLKPRVRELASNLLDRIEPGTPVDLISAYAFPLPIQVICELLGVPVEDRPMFEQASVAVGHLIGAGPSRAQLEEAHRGTVELLDYFRGLIEQRRKSSKDENDLLSTLLAAGHDEEDPLTDEEIAAIAALVLGAGHDTTVNLIGNGVHALICHPAEMSKLRNDPGLIASAVEEFLRYDSSVQVAPPSTPAEDLEMDGIRMGAGEVLFILLGAANRDPSHFHDPDRLDIERRDNRHLSFGGGIHGCLGPSLAKMEAKIAINELLARFKNIELAADHLTWRNNFTLRGLESLPIMASGTRFRATVGSEM